MASPADLYKSAQQGNKLTPTERRSVISYLEETGTQASNWELAQLFQVDEKVIRRDRLRLLRQYASQINPKLAMQYVAKYARSHERYLSQAREALSKAQVGTLSHQNYLKLCSDLEQRLLGVMQDVGIVPKELGHMAISKEEWVAEFDDAGVAHVRENDGRAQAPKLLEEGQPIDAEVDE